MPTIGSKAMKPRFGRLGLVPVRGTVGGGDAAGGVVAAAAFDGWPPAASGASRSATTACVRRIRRIQDDGAVVRTEQHIELLRFSLHAHHCASLRVAFQVPEHVVEVDVL